MTPEGLLIPAVIFLATSIRSAFGFGEALVAVPLLAFLVPVEVAAPLAALASVTVAAIVLIQDWGDVHLGSAGRLVLATAFGVPVGLLALTRVGEPTVKAALGVLIIAFSAWSLIGPRRFELKDDRGAWIFGLVAGILGGAYGMNGPPLVVYGTLRKWSPRHFRATLQGYFLPASLLVVAGYGWAGLLTGPVLGHYLVSLPAILVAIFVGRHLNRGMGRARFLLYIHLALIAIGAALLAQGVIG